MSKSLEDLATKMGERVTEAVRRHRREQEALKSILYGETGQRWLSAHAHPTIQAALGLVIHAHSCELDRLMAEADEKH